MNQDLQHLKLLSIFYYVVGGMLALVACIPILHFTVGVMMLAAPNTMSGGGTPPPPFVGWLFVLIAGGLILLGWVWATCLMAAGWFLGRRKHYIYCFIMGCSACLFNPLGTVLGVFTIIVLVRPSVKRLFEIEGLPDDPPEPNELPGDYKDHILRDTRDIRAAHPG
jgi:hypothetical protein